MQQTCHRAEPHKTVHITSEAVDKEKKKYSLVNWQN